MRFDFKLLPCLGNNLIARHEQSKLWKHIILPALRNFHQKPGKMVVSVCETRSLGAEWLQYRVPKRQKWDLKHSQCHTLRWPLSGKHRGGHLVQCDPQNECVQCQIQEAQLNAKEETTPQQTSSTCYNGHRDLKLRNSHSAPFPSHASAWGTGDLTKSQGLWY